MHISKKFLFITWLCFSVFSCIAIYIYVNFEHNIYFWDYSGYWYKYQDIIPTFVRPFNAIEKLFDSMLRYDYNNFIVFFPAVLGVVLGKSRVAYESSLFILYLVPVALLTGILCQNIINKYIIQNKSIEAFFSGAIISFLFLPFWYATLRGYPDIAGLIPICLSFLFILKKNLSEKIEYKSAIILGILLYFPFLLRRWYLYSIIILYFTFPVLSFCLTIYPNQTSNPKYVLPLKNFKLLYKKTKYLLINFIIAGFTSILCAFCLQSKTILRIIQTSYSKEYSYYQLGLKYSVTSFIDTVGIIYLALICLSFVYILYKGKLYIKLISLFCSINMIFIFLFFSYTQTPGIHHLLMIEFWGLIILILGFNLYVHSMQFAKVFTCFLAISLCFVILVLGLCNSPNSLSSKLHLYPAAAPLYIENYPEYQRLAQFLDHTVTPTEKLAIFFNRNIINNGLLDNILNRTLNSRMVHVSHVDFRDKFDMGALLAKYYLVGKEDNENIDTLMNQKVLQIPNESIIEQKNIGKSMQPIGPVFYLADKTEVQLYQKVRPFSEKGIEELIDELCVYYPDWRQDLEKDASSLAQ